MWKIWVNLTQPNPNSQSVWLAIYLTRNLIDPFLTRNLFDLQLDWLDPTCPFAMSTWEALMIWEVLIMTWQWEVKVQSILDKKVESVDLDKNMCTQMLFMWQFEIQNQHHKRANEQRDFQTSTHKKFMK